MSRRSRSSRGSPGNLPQRQESWHVVVHRLRTWIAPPDEDPWRPYIVLALSVDTGTLHAAQVVQNDPTAAEIADALFQGMMKPPKGTRQKPHRPTQVQCEDAALAEALAQQLEPIGITVRQHPRPEGLDTLLCELESHMREGPELADLLSVEGVTPELVGGLFAAAAEFHRAAPWVQLTEENVLAVRVPPEKEARFVQVMGGGGVEYGLATYTRWEDVERMYEMADSPLELLPPEGAHSFLFGDITLLPFGDLEAMEQHGWDVAGKEAYPLPLIFTREKQATRPSRADLEWYEAALRAIPLFVRDHLRADEQGNYLPAEAAFSVPVHSGKTTVHITYPAGALPKETRPVEMGDWAEIEDEEEEDEEGFPAFDRRAMEGILAGLGGGFGDSALAEAQDLMYKAWGSAIRHGGSSSPTRRLPNRPIVPMLTCSWPRRRRTPWAARWNSISKGWQRGSARWGRIILWKTRAISGACWKRVPICVPARAWPNVCGNWAATKKPSHITGTCCA